MNIWKIWGSDKNHNIQLNDTMDTLKLLIYKQKKNNWKIKYWWEHKATEKPLTQYPEKYEEF